MYMWVFVKECFVCCFDMLRLCHSGSLSIMQLTECPPFIHCYTILLKMSYSRSNFIGKQNCMNLTAWSTSIID